MKRFVLSISTGVLVVFGALGLAAALRAQTSTQLYLMTGLATPQGNLDVPSVVYRVDQSAGSATPVVELLGPNDGSDFIQADHDRRLIVIGSGSVKPSRLVVLSMDAPSQLRSIPTGSYYTLIRNFLFEDRDGRPIEAFHVGPCCGQDRVIGFDLAQDATAPQELTWDDVRYVRRDGSWPPGDDTRLEVFRGTERLHSIRREEWRTWASPHPTALNETARIS